MSAGGDVVQRTILEGIQVNRYSASAAFAILYFDYCITFPLEIEAFWKKPVICWTSFLFVLNRYGLLLGSAPIVLEFFGGISELQCRRLQTYHQYIMVITQWVVAALLTMRTYALYGKNRLVLAPLATIIFVDSILALWSAVATSPFDEMSGLFSNRYGCDLSVPMQQTGYWAAAWGIVLLFDTIVFLLTIVRRLRERNLWNASLFRLCLRDGALYYAVMVIINIVNVLTIVLPSPEQKAMFATLTNVISSTLMSRLMLNLREPDRDASPAPSTAYNLTRHIAEPQAVDVSASWSGTTAKSFLTSYNSVDSCTRA